MSEGFVENLNQWSKQVEALVKAAQLVVQDVAEADVLFEPPAAWAGDREGRANDLKKLRRATKALAKLSEALAALEGGAKL